MVAIVDCAIECRNDVDERKSKTNCEPDKLIKLPCRHCGQTTNHSVRTEVRVQHHFEEEGVSFSEDYQIVECRGCETVGFRTEYWNDHDLFMGPDGPEPVRTATLYPNPEAGRSGVSDLRLVPTKIANIYLETLAALNSGHRILAGVGLRAVVESITKDKGATTGNLKKRIDDLVTAGVLTADGAEILHQIRTLGNASAHEVQPHDEQQLGLALDVVDHVLQASYILPHHAKATLPKTKP